MIEEGNLRVWNVINPPNKPCYFPVATPEEGNEVITRRAKHQLKNPSIVSNAFGLEVYEHGEWCEWYNEFGEDINELFDEDNI